MILFDVYAIDYFNCIKWIYRNALQLLWRSKYGRRAIVHLLLSKSKISLDINDSVGMVNFRGKNYFVYGMNAPPYHAKTWNYDNLVEDYDFNPVFKEQRITLFVGSFYFGLKDSSVFLNDKIIHVDLKTGLRTTGIKHDTLHIGKDKPKRFDPKHKCFTYSSMSAFLYLCLIHEITHTMSVNNYLTHVQMDSESPAYEAELKAKRKLKKILRSKMGEEEGK